MARRQEWRQRPYRRYRRRGRLEGKAVIRYYVRAYDTHEAVIADNRTLVGKGYQPIVAVAVWERRTDKMVARFNVVMP
jgi:hypothetical protein